MTQVAYHVVEHDGGWAYKVGEVFSETFPSKELAHAAAARAAREQRTPGEAPPSNTKTAPEIGTTNTLRGAIAPMRKWRNEARNQKSESHF